MRRPARTSHAALAGVVFALSYCTIPAGASVAATAPPPSLGGCDTSEWARPARAALVLAERADDDHALEYLQDADENIAEGRQTMSQTPGCNDRRVLSGFDLLEVWSRVQRGGRGFKNDRPVSACTSLHLAAWRVYLAQNYAVFYNRRVVFHDNAADVAHVVALAQAEATRLTMAPLPYPGGGGPSDAAATYGKRYVRELATFRAASPKSCIPRGLR